MKHLITLAILLLATNATAGGKPHGHSNSNSNSASFSKSASHSKSASAASSNAQASSVGQGGEAASLSSATGGKAGANATGGSVGNIGNTSQVGGDVSIEGDRIPRQAPGVALVAPPSTDRYKCLGVGGSNKTGSALLGWCWRARDAWAQDRAITLADMKLYEASARAYCSKKTHRRDFGGDEQACRAGWHQALINREIDQGSKVITQEQCNTQQGFAVGRALEECQK